MRLDILLQYIGLEWIETRRLGRPDNTALTRTHYFVLGLFDEAIWRAEVRARMRGGCGGGIKRHR